MIRLHSRLFAWTAALATLAWLGSAFAQDTTNPVDEGAFYLGRGECNLAEFAYQDALEENPGDVTALVGLGRAQRCLGDTQGAVTTHRQAVLASGQALEPLVELALSYRADATRNGLDQTALNDALETADVAKQLNPDDPRPHAVEGFVLLDVGSTAAAAEALQTAIDRMRDEGAVMDDAEKARVYLNLGRAQRDLNDLDAARSALEAAATRDPSNAQAFALLGDVEFLRGSCEAALIAMERATELSPDAPLLLGRLGITRIQCGEPEQAVAALQQATRDDAALFAPALFTYLAEAYLAVGQSAAAVEPARKGSLLPPERADAWVVLARALLERGYPGDVEQARNAVQRAAELDPSLTNLADDLGL
mgnify:FL=1